MELRHEFTVPVPLGDAWRALLDIERVAPCLPGTTVEDYDGRTVTGSVKVRLGPITVAYKGTAVFEEQDETAHRLVLAANGRETRGQGTARATVTADLEERDGVTAVSVRTDLTVTGRPAQFGRGVLAEVGDRLVGQFADCLSRRLAGATPPAGPAAPAAAGRDAAPAPEPTPVVRPAPAPVTVPAASGADRDMRPGDGAGSGGGGEPIDLLRVAGVPVARRAAAVAGAAVAVALLIVGVRRLRRG
ncbi:SRPBCC family protein [Streptomyces seoulensis]